MLIPPLNDSSETWAPLENDGDVIEELWNEGGSLKVLIHGFNGIVGRDPTWVMQSMFVIGRGNFLKFIRRFIDCLNPAIKIILI